MRRSTTATTPGTALWKPQGFFGNNTGPYYTPFDEWPKELQEQYRYNPEKAEQLLDEAGYPRGADGVRFRVTYDHRDVIDLGLAEIAAGYFKEIGVEVEINIMNTPEYLNRRSEGAYEMSTGDAGWDMGLLAVLAGVIIAVPIGIYSAIRQYTVADYAGRAVAIFGLATPNFWLGLMVMIYPAIWWGWTPPLTHVGFAADPWANLGIFIIPALILGTYLAASTMRMTRTMMLEVLRQDYVRTAWAKGLEERRVVLRHAVKNALIPVVTLVALQMPIIAGGSVIIENIFNLPGLGRLMLAALNERDYRRHHRLRRRARGHLRATLRRRLDVVSRPSHAAHHHVDRRARRGADHPGARDGRRHSRLPSGTRRRDRRQGRTPTSRRRRRSAARAGARCCATCCPTSPRR